MLGKRPWKMAVGVAAIALLAAGCSSGSSDDTEALPNSVVIGVGEPEHLLPTDTTEANGSEVLASLYYPLVKFDSKNEPQLVAAESITPDKTNKTWTIKLKPDFTFSNGEPVTADNYISAWNYGAYGPNGQLAGYYFARIQGYAAMQPVDPDGDGPEKAKAPTATKLSGLQKVNDLTFKVVLSEPFAGWEAVMGYDCFYPLPKAAFSSPGVIAKGFEDAPIGNGPFKMKGKWEHDQQIQVEKVADFKGQVPKVDAITWRIYQDLGAEYADLVAGNVDVQTQIPVENLSAASADLGTRFQKSPNSLFQFIGFPLKDPQFKDPRVRRAISMALNRQEMTDQLSLGSQSPATSFVSPVVDGYRPDSCGENCLYNPTKAKQLYQQANGPRTITVTYNTDGGYKPWIDAMCNQIKASLGINCVGHAEAKLPDVLKKVEAGESVGLIRLAWVMDYPLMEDYLTPLYSTGGSSNYYGYSNSSFDSLIKEGSEAKTPAGAVKKWQEAEDILAEDMPVIPLRFGENVFGYSEKVTNVTVDLFQKVDIYNIEVAD
ncbi:ABC transporter substrate-binding protein [Actinoplanes sp. NPDC051343]|uniref:peptide ABC transporter substrate-binding protein n=1 Tax=Actinoplanes sp. NPDC051343 TaxID=3363906 RepID=UPI0037AD51E5